MKIVCLTQELDEEQKAKQGKNYLKLLADYSEFVCGLVGEDTKKKILKCQDDLICYIVDGGTQIPRSFDGVEKTFRMPSRAVAFVREEKKEDSTNLKHLKQGLAVRYNEWNLGAICHEANHCFAKPLTFNDEEGEVVKLGLNLAKIENDKFVAKTGNLIDEGVTDAIAEYFYEEKIRVKDTNLPEYSTVYSQRKACSILLGKDLSNKKFLSAYFGDKEELFDFVEEFDEVMKDEGVKFRDVLKSDFDYNECIDGVNFRNEELTSIFSIYQLKKCKSDKELDETKKWLDELGVDCDVLLKEKLQ